MKLDLVPALPGCPFCGASPSRINGISLVDPEKEYFICPNGHTGRLSRDEWCAQPAPDLLPLLREAKERIAFGRTLADFLHKAIAGGDPQKELLYRAHELCIALSPLARLDAALAPEAQGREPSRPRVICLCGSTRFTGNMLVQQWELTKRGYIVLSWCALPEGYFAGDGTHGAEQEGIKEAMDELHKRKIDLSDEVFVINLGGYIGESTQSEIEYASSQGKPVRYMERRATGADDTLRGEGEEGK